MEADRIGGTSVAEYRGMLLRNGYCCECVQNGSAVRCSKPVPAVFQRLHPFRLSPDRQTGDLEHISFLLQAAGIGQHRHMRLLVKL